MKKLIIIVLACLLVLSGAYFFINNIQSLSSQGGARTSYLYGKLLNMEQNESRVVLDITRFSQDCIIDEKNIVLKGKYTGNAIPKEVGKYYFIKFINWNNDNNEIEEISEGESIDDYRRHCERSAIDALSLPSLREKPNYRKNALLVYGTLKEIIEGKSEKLVINQEYRDCNPTSPEDKTIEAYLGDYKNLLEVGKKYAFVFYVDATNGKWTLSNYTFEGTEKGMYAGVCAAYRADDFDMTSPEFSCKVEEGQSGSMEYKSCKPQVIVINVGEEKKFNLIAKDEADYAINYNIEHIKVMREEGRVIDEPVDNSICSASYSTDTHIIKPKSEETSSFTVKCNQKPDADDVYIDVKYSFVDLMGYKHFASFQSKANKLVIQ